MYTVYILKWFIDYLKYANEFKLFVVVVDKWTCYGSKSESLIGVIVRARYHSYGLITVKICKLTV